MNPTQSNTGAIYGTSNLATQGNPIAQQSPISELLPKRKPSLGEQAQVMSLLTSDEEVDIIRAHHLVTYNNFCLNTITSGRKSYFEAKIKKAFVGINNQ